MANHTGSEGSVAVGANTVAEVRGFSVSRTGEVIEDTEMSDATKSFKAGNTGWSGSIECWWDETDTTGQGAMTTGSTVTLNLYHEGATTGDTSLSGSAIITAIDTVSGTNGIVEANFQFQGTGVLTEAAI